MAIDTIKSSAVLDGAIATADIADDAVTSAKIDSTSTGMTLADLTVDTNTLKVDATNNRVGIGVTSPDSELHLATGSKIKIHSGGNSGNLEIQNGGGTTKFDLGGGSASQNFRFSLTSNTGSFFTFTTNTGEIVRISNNGLHIGGTANANALDDYEEGTATVTMNGGSAHPVSRLQTTAYYTKIGSTVNVNFEFNNVNTTGYAGYISVFGLPFAASSPSGTVTRQVCGQIAVYGGATFSSDGGIFGRLNEGGTEIILWNNGSNTSWESVTHNAGASRYLIMNITYRTDS